MPQDISQPDPQIVIDLLTAFRKSKVMFAAVELGVFDALAEGPRSLRQLSAPLKANPDALERLLDARRGLGLLTLEASSASTSDAGDKQYANTPAATAYLCQQSPQRMTGYIRYSNDVMWNLWGELADAVREGTHRWNQVYGWDGPIFSHFFRDEEAKREFLMGMHGFGIISSPHVVQAFDLSEFYNLVDLGGATGHLAVAACRRYPQMQAVVFDLPEAIPLAQEMIAEAGMSDRVGTVAGDFFTNDLPDGDLMAVGRILHDWSEDKIHKLLKRIYDRLPPGGALLIAEKLLLDDKSGPSWAQLQSLNMLTCTEGKERTLAEYEALLHQAGFQAVNGCRTNSPLDAVLARK